MCCIMLSARFLATLQVSSLLLESLELVSRHLGCQAGNPLLLLLDLFPLLGDLSLALLGMVEAEAIGISNHS